MNPIDKLMMRRSGLSIKRLLTGFAKQSSILLFDIIPSHLLPRIVATQLLNLRGTEFEDAKGLCKGQAAGLIDFRLISPPTTVGQV